LQRHSVIAIRDGRQFFLKNAKRQTPFFFILQNAKRHSKLTPDANAIAPIPDCDVSHKLLFDSSSFYSWKFESYNGDKSKRKSNISKNVKNLLKWTQKKREHLILGVGTNVKKHFCKKKWVGRRQGRSKNGGCMEGSLAGGILLFVFNCHLVGLRRRRRSRLLWEEVLGGNRNKTKIIKIIN
jgi:hypothetical protein